MTVHLIKLSVGPESLSDLAGWQANRLKEMKRRGTVPELMHITRHMPKRAAELLDGGSIYWVIKGWLVARQKLLELRAITYDGTPHCGLVIEQELVRVVPRRHRPFQGWRYLDAKDAPRDLVKGAVDAEMPEELRRELAELGLV